MNRDDFTAALKRHAPKRRAPFTKAQEARVRQIVHEEMARIDGIALGES